MPSKKPESPPKTPRRAPSYQNPARSNLNRRRSNASTRPRKTYRQDWPAYNAAQTHEKRLFQSLLLKFTEGLEHPKQHVNGRPRIPLKVLLFCAACKVYSTFPARRFMTDVREAHAAGLIEVVPHFNSILKLLEEEALTPVLLDLIVASSLPLRGMETCFAIDSTGFTGPLYLDVEGDADDAGAGREQHGWVKVHAMCGVKTQIITAIDIRGPHSADTNSFPCLLNKTAESFCVKEVSADKAYFSRKNFDLAEKIKARAYIPFKSNSTGTGSALMEEMYHHFQLKRADFMRHYHKRSNVEALFSALKRKFGWSIRSKGKRAMINEVLLKALCHNLCVLIQVQQELGTELNFE